MTRPLLFFPTISNGDEPSRSPKGIITATSSVSTKDKSLTLASASNKVAAIASPELAMRIHPSRARAGPAPPMVLPVRSFQRSVQVTAVSLGESTSDKALHADIQLQLWADRFLEEVKTIKSRIIAAELLTKRILEAMDPTAGPDGLTTAAAGYLALQAISLLPIATRPLLRSVLSILWEVVYRSCAVLTPLLAAPDLDQVPSAALSPLLSQTYFAALGAVSGRYLVERRKAQHFSRLKACEQRVVDRTVGLWKISHVRTVFFCWRSFVVDRSAHRDKNRKLYGRTSTKATIINAMSNWRLRSKEVHLKALLKSNVAMADRIKVAAQENEKVATELEKQQAVGRKRRARCEGLLTQAAEMKIESEDKGDSLRRMLFLHERLRAQWASVTASLFGDVRQVPATVSDWLGSHIAVNVIEGSADIRRKIKKNRNKFNPEVMLALTRVLVPRSEGTDEGSSAIASVAASFEIEDSVFSSGSGVIRPLLTDDASIGPNAKAALACVLYRQCTGGMQQPASAVDIIRGDQLRQQLQGTILLSLLAGGHCSAFVPYMPTATAPMTGFQSAVAGIPPPTAATCPEEAPLLMADWQRGQHALESTLPHYRYVSAAVASASQVGSKVQSHRELELLYDRFLQVSVGSEFPREVAEATLIKVIRQEDWPLIDLLYPKDGIKGFSEFSNYISEVAEVEEMALGELIAKMEDEFDITLIVEFQLQLASEEAKSVLRQHATSIEALFLDHSSERVIPKPPHGSEASAVLLRRRRRSASIVAMSANKPPLNGNDEARPGTEASTDFSPAASREMSLEQFKAALATVIETIKRPDLITDDEVTSAYATCAVDTARHLTHRSFTVLLAVVSTYYQPSPFVTFADKLQGFFCASFDDQPL